MGTSMESANKDALTGGPRVFAHVNLPASVAGNRGQLFAYNPAGSGVTYRAHIITLRGGPNGGGAIPQFFFDTSALADASVVDAVGYLVANKAVVPSLLVFARDTLAANILAGSRRINWRNTGTVFGSDGPLTGMEIPAGSWFAWSPPTGSGELNMEATFIESRP